MKVLVTGATGFVGSTLVPHLRGRGHDVVRVTRTKEPDAIALDLCSASVTIPPRTDAVVHLAQSRAYRDFPGDAEAMFAVNVAATHALLNAAAKAGVSRFCLVSSGTVYEPFAGPMEEEDALAPLGPLGATKLAAEIVARPYEKLFKLPILRLFAPYGPGQKDRLIPQLMARIRDGRPVDVSNDGEGRRLALIHVEDTCAVITASIEQEWTGTINVASRQVLSIAEIARVLAGHMGREPLFARTQSPAPPLVPSLERLARLYDLSSMRQFQSSAQSIVSRG